MSLLCIQLTLKHKHGRLSTVFHGGNVYKYTPGNTLSFCETNGLTFVVCRAKVWSSKRISQTAVTKTVRQFGLPESRRLVRAGSPSPQDPSLPSRCAERTHARCIRLPALRDRICWSPKGRRRPQVEWYRGYCLTRLKKKVSSWGVFYFTEYPYGTHEMRALQGVSQLY